MKASMLDLRRRMKSIIKALDHRESVTLTYRGKDKGIIYPIQSEGEGDMRVEEHPFFGMSKSSSSVQDEVNKLRKGRYNDL